MLAAQNPNQAVTIRSADETIQVLKRCREEEPTLREVQPQHGAACHQIATYDQAKPMMPKLDHRREVVPEVVEGVLP